MASLPKVASASISLGFSAVDVHFVLPDGKKVDEQLPLGKAVEIPLTIDRAAEIPYGCGMNMVRGTIVVQ